jgi:hypothetical protein
MGGRRVAGAFMLVVAVASLAGCASQIGAIDDQICKSEGAFPGTNAYAGCRLMRDASRQAAEVEKPSRQRVCGAAVNGAICR